MLILIIINLNKIIYKSLLNQNVYVDNTQNWKNFSVGFNSVLKKIRISE